MKDLNPRKKDLNPRVLDSNPNWWKIQNCFKSFESLSFRLESLLLEVHLMLGHNGYQLWMLKNFFLTTSSKRLQRQ